jgi:hypothetical protein
MAKLVCNWLVGRIYLPMARMQFPRLVRRLCCLRAQLRQEGHIEWEQTHPLRRARRYLDQAEQLCADRACGRCRAPYIRRTRRADDSPRLDRQRID